jgi:hypothetical protein
MVDGELALLSTVMVPLTVPAVVGENVTLSAIDWLGERIKFGEMPLALNPAPETFKPKSVISELPLFARVTVDELLLFMVTLPKLRLAGFAPST